MTTNNSNKYPVKSLVKTLKVIEFLGSSEDGKTLAEISSTLKIGKSTVHRLLATLKDHSFVWFDPNTSRYLLGIRMLQLGQQVKARWGDAILERLANATGETCNLAVLDGTEVLYVVIKESSNPLRMSGRPGKKLPAHCTALGKALLSGFSREEILRLYGKRRKLESPTPNSISSVPELCDYLERNKPASVFVDNEEMFPGVICLAAPVRNAQGKIVAGISISSPKQRASSDRLGEFRSLLINAAQELSQHLGHQDAPPVKEAVYA